MDTTNPKANAVHFPPDRRQRVWVQPRWLLAIGLLIAIPLFAAWGQYLLYGLPAVPAFTLAQLKTLPDAQGFPAWLRIAHYVNFLFIVLLIRSGLSILVDHPRLYGNIHCTPDTEWARFTPLAVPKDRLWTAKDDARYLSPWLSLPGFRHTVGIARQWHFLSVLFWVANGLIYVVLFLLAGRWSRLAPTSWQIVPEAWAVFVHYATFHLPPEPNGLYHYNAMQQIAYFAVVFIMAPLTILSGIGMSPAMGSRFKWYPRLFGGRQGARSLHFLLMVGYVIFIVIHVSLVALTGFARNMNHIVFGTDVGGNAGLVVGTIAIVAVALVCGLANRLSWHRPRTLQRLGAHTVGVLKRWTLNPLRPRAEYKKSDISPFFWPNGKLPTSREWQELADDDFRQFRLRVYGLVQNPVELSLQELREMGKRQQITLHQCIQGWSGIAEWGGLPLTELAALVHPQDEAKVVVFHTFGEGLYGGEYYETQSMADALHPQSILAYEMNYGPLSKIYGAPLRLRVENQLGYKMAKWIKSIEFVTSETQVGEGFGGKNEDDEYFDLVPNI